MPSTRRPRRCLERADRASRSRRRTYRRRRDVEARAASAAAWRSRTAAPAVAGPQQGRITSARPAQPMNSESSSSSCALPLAPTRRFCTSPSREDEQRRDAHHVEAARDVRVVVDVELRDLRCARVLAWRSPRAPVRSSCTARTTRPRSRRGPACRRAPIDSSKVASESVTNSVSHGSSFRSRLRRRGDGRSPSASRYRSASSAAMQPDAGGGDRLAVHVVLHVAARRTRPAPRSASCPASVTM